MTKLQYKHAGIILAAGASSRMGEPKALLQTASGLPLALHQANVLLAGGVNGVVIVLGCEGERICGALLESAGRTEAAPPTVAVNTSWQSGRVTSIQEGIRAAGDAHGALILPVDTVGVRHETVREILCRAECDPSDAVRPVHRKKPGNLLWVSRRLFSDILGIEAGEGVRFNDWIGDRAAEVEVDDPAIMNNVNTQEEWERLKQHLVFKEDAFGDG